MRHGETAGNRSFRHQYPETPLSPYGRAQAEKAGTHFVPIPLDVIIASPLARTTETAQVIAKQTGTPLELSDLFVELRRPRILWGKSWFSFETIRIFSMIYMNARKTQWHFSDEENLEEFHARTRRALEFLADRPEKNILVVTHRGFMAGLRERIKYDGMDNVAQYRRALWKNLTIPNCSYLTATWDPRGEYGETLDGTWNMQNGVVRPPGVKSRIGLG